MGLVGGGSGVGSGSGSGGGRGSGSGIGGRGDVGIALVIACPSSKALAGGVAPRCRRSPAAGADPRCITEANERVTRSFTRSA